MLTNTLCLDKHFYIHSDPPFRRVDIIELLRAIPVKGWSIIIAGIGAFLLFAGGSPGGGVGAFFAILGLVVGGSGLAVGGLAKPQSNPPGGKRSRVAVTRALEREITKRANRRCEIPGCKLVSGSLEIHHTNGDRAHNVAENLLWVCHRHHDELTRGIISPAEATQFLESVARARTQTPAGTPASACDTSKKEIDLS